MLLYRHPPYVVIARHNVVITKSTVSCYNETICRYNEIRRRYKEIMSRFQDIHQMSLRRHICRYNDIIFLFYVTRIGFRIPTTFSHKY